MSFVRVSLQNCIGSISSTSGSNGTSSASSANSSTSSTTAGKNMEPDETFLLVTPSRQPRGFVDRCVWVRRAPLPNNAALEQ